MSSIIAALVIVALLVSIWAMFKLTASQWMILLACVIILYVISWGIWDWRPFP